MSEKCPHCGLIHEMTCSRIKAIEYADDGVTVKRIEFHPPVPMLVPQWSPADMPMGERPPWWPPYRIT